MCDVSSPDAQWNIAATADAAVDADAADAASGGDATGAVDDAAADADAASGGDAEDVVNIATGSGTILSCTWYIHLHCMQIFRATSTIVPILRLNGPPLLGHT